jgi:hypothetical protein
LDISIQDINLEWFDFYRNTPMLATWNLLPVFHERPQNQFSTAGLIMAAPQALPVGPQP